MTLPYTYVIHHIPTGLNYYGVRYAKNCHPTDLWNKYFTSSKIVKSLIKEYGINSFTYKIRKTFNSAEKAILWEEKVLRKLDVMDNDKWINLSIAGAVKMTAEVRKKISFTSKGRKPNLGKKASEETKEKMRQARKGKPSPNKGKKCPESAKIIKRLKLSGKSKSLQMRQKLSKTATNRRKKYNTDGTWTWEYSKCINP